MDRLTLQDRSMKYVTINSVKVRTGWINGWMDRCITKAFLAKLVQDPIASLRPI